MPQYSTIALLAQITADQWGLVTRRQAERAGMSPATIARLSGSGGLLERVAHGVYRMTTAPIQDNLALRAAWLQLAPGVPAWQRTAADGVVSHRSAAAVYNLGDLAADHHDFTISDRHQTRRRDVRVHTRVLTDGEWMNVGGLLATRTSRIASDLLYDNEDPEAVGRIVTEAIRVGYDHPGTFADALSAHALRFGLRRNDGISLLRWLLDLVGDPAADGWIHQARERAARLPARAAVGAHRGGEGGADPSAGERRCVSTTLHRVPRRAQTHG